MDIKNESDSLELQRQIFCQRRFLALPLAGTICWALVAISSLFVVNINILSWILFIATGSIIYVAMLIGRFTGESFFKKTKNTFDRLFLYSLMMSLSVYAIAIPFFLIEPSSLPLTIGILTGLMWIPFSWIINHWIGIFHSLSRSFLIVGIWYVFPEQRFTLIPAAIIVIYCISIALMENRWKTIQKSILV